MWIDKNVGPVPVLKLHQAAKMTTLRQSGESWKMYRQPHLHRQAGDHCCSGVREDPEWSGVDVWRPSRQSCKHYLSVTSKSCLINVPDFRNQNLTVRGICTSARNWIKQSSFRSSNAIFFCQKIVLLYNVDVKIGRFYYHLNLFFVFVRSSRRRTAGA